MTVTVTMTPYAHAHIQSQPSFAQHPSADPMTVTVTVTVTVTEDPTEDMGSEARRVPNNSEKHRSPSYPADPTNNTHMKDQILPTAAVSTRRLSGWSPVPA